MHAVRVGRTTVRTAHEQIHCLLDEARVERVQPGGQRGEVDLPRDPPDELAARVVRAVALVPDGREEQIDVAVDHHEVRPVHALRPRREASR